MQQELPVSCKLYKYYVDIFVFYPLSYRYYGVIVVPDPDPNFNISETNFDTQYPNVTPHVSRGNNRYYITAAWNDPDLVPRDFTVGDQSNTEAIRNGTAETYHNAKLRRKTPYCIYIVGHGEWNRSNVSYTYTKMEHLLRFLIFRTLLFDTQN